MVSVTLTLREQREQLSVERHYTGAGGHGANGGLLPSCTRFDQQRCLIRYRLLLLGILRLIFYFETEKGEREISSSEPALFSPPESILQSHFALL